MPRKALTDRIVDGLTSTGKPQIDYFDTLCTGLAIRVTSRGKKTWSFMYTSPHDGKKRARITIGTYPATGLRKAREKAIMARGKIEDGVDPRDEKGKPVKKNAASVETRHAERDRSGIKVMSARDSRIENQVSAKWHRQRATTKVRHFIRQWRKFRGIKTQDKLANLCGITRATISRLESGDLQYRQWQLEKISLALDCEPAHLIGIDPTDMGDILQIYSRIPDNRRELAPQVLQSFVEKL